MNNELFSAIDSTPPTPLQQARTMLRECDQELMKAEFEASEGKHIDLAPFRRAVARATEITKDAKMKEIASSVGVEACGLHRRTPYGMTNVSMTQLSIARHYGGIKYNGDSYTYLPKTDELIRDDVIKWQRKQKRAAKTPNSGTQRPGDAEATNATRTTPPGSLK